MPGGIGFRRRFGPYRTADNRIAGAVIVFVDIDPLKRMLKAAEEARDYAEGMIETVREPLLVLDGDCECSGRHLLSTRSSRSLAEK